jgi:hypothetical protein
MSSPFNLMPNDGPLRFYIIQTVQPIQDLPIIQSIELWGQLGPVGGRPSYKA